MSAVKFETITPEIAQTMLASNANNRPARDRHVFALAEEMEAGRWHADSNDAIVFSRNGELLNGQHRLKAVLLSGATIRALVMRGADESVYGVIDRGLGRVTGDLFHRYGVPSAHRAAAMLRIWFFYLKDSKITTSGAVKVPSEILYELYCTDPEGFDEAVRCGGRTGHHFRESVMSACAYMGISDGKRDAVARVVDVLSKGYAGALEPGDPARALLQWFMSANLVRQKLDPSDVAEAFRKVVNAVHEGTEIRRLVIKREVKK